MVMAVAPTQAGQFRLRMLQESSDIHGHLGLVDNPPPIWLHPVEGANALRFGAPPSPHFEGPQLYGRVVQILSCAAADRPSDVSTTVSNRNELNVAIPSVGTPLEGQPGSRAAQPQMKRIIRRHPLLTPAVVSLLQPLRSVVLSKALQASLDVAELGVDVEEDPEERTGQVVLRVYIRASAVQTLAFWDSLEIEMGRWLEHLNDRDRRTLLEDIGLRFHWITR